MIKHLRFAVMAAALTAFAGAAGAQEPGGLNKVAHDVSNTVKKAGRDTKAEVKRDASKAHGALKVAGNDTKAELKRTTGIKAPQRNQPGGLNKVARNISNASKTAARDTRDEKNRVKSKAHGDLTTTGKNIKESVKKP